MNRFPDESSRRAIPSAGSPDLADARHPEHDLFASGTTATVAYHNHQRYHESPGNLTPADVYFVRDKAIIKKGRRIKEDTMKKRRLAHMRQAA